MRTGICIDGGGIKGIGSARLLRELNYCGEDFVAGTSVGAILAAMRCAGMSWERVYNVFVIEAPDIFAKPSMAWRVNPFKPRFNNVNLKAILKKYLGDKRMKDLTIPCFITASDFATGKPKVFDCTDDVLVRDAVLMSAAAPTYFPPVDERYADGGMWANNPCLVGVGGYSHKYGVDIEQIRCLSIGTGGDFYVGTKVSENMSAPQWAPKIIDFVLNCTEDAAGFTAEQFMKDRYFRVEPHVAKKFELDDVAQMGDYESIWYHHWLANKDTISKWVFRA